MASTNVFLTPSVIAKETLMWVENELAMSRHVYKEFRKEFVKVGATVTIRKPNKFVVYTSQTMSYSNIEEPSTTVTIDKWRGVSWDWSSTDLSLTIDKYSERYIQPACRAIANKIDLELCGLYADVYNHVGSPGTAPNSFQALSLACERLDDEAAPDNRMGVLDPRGKWAMANGLFTTAGIAGANKKATDIVTKGYLGEVAGVNLYGDQNIVKHTCGHYTSGATPLVDGAGQTGASLLTKGWDVANNYLNVGDVFTIDGVYAVNPVSFQSTGVLREFVVKTHVHSAAGAATIAISPSIVTSGPYQTVDAAPADSAALNFVSGTEDTAYPQNLVFTPQAFGLVFVPIEKPDGVWGARESDEDSGISILLVKDFDVVNHKQIVRLDCLFGIKTLYPEMACRMTG